MSVARSGRVCSTQEMVRQMFYFLQGWRRKAGCVLLVTAWVLSIGWIRSFTTADIVVVPPITAISGNGELELEIRQLVVSVLGHRSLSIRKWRPKRTAKTLGV